MWNGRALVALVLVCALGTASCGRDEPQQLLRLGELVELHELAPQVLDVSGPVTEEKSLFPVAVEAAHYARLEIRARGDATMLELGWKLGQERILSKFRRLSFPTVADGEVHTYEVNLQREPYWVGQVDQLELSTRGGEVEILKVTVTPAASAYRDLALGGESLPSLPAIERYVLQLPPDLPDPLTFEANLGIVPSFDREGVQVRFRAFVEHEGEEIPWLDQTVAGLPGREAGGWTSVRQQVSAPSGSRLVLETTATRHDQPLPEGAGAWGNPLLVAGRRGAEPDVIVVVIDTLRADVLGSYGSPDGLTPHLDQLAARSVRFDDLSAPAPWTLPSVASLITGLHPQTHGAGQRRGNFAPTGLTAASHTLAEVLSGAGFFTAGIYHNIYLNPPFGLHQGYDSYLSAEVEDDQLVDRALATLERYRDRRLFLYLHLFGPHNPYEPPEPECTEVARRLRPDYPGSLGCAGDRRPQGPMPPFEDRPWMEALYKAEVAFTDRQLGRLFEVLEEQYPDALLLVTSDHGEDFWERQPQLRAHDYRLNADHGHHHFQQLSRVPGILRFPGTAPAEIREATELVDFFPTLLDALSLEAPAHQGRNLRPLLEGRPLPRLTRLSDRLLYGYPRWSVRRGPWKLVVPQGGELAPELYHLEEDPGETTDRAAQEAETVEALLALGQEERARRLKDRERYLSGQDVLSATYLEWNHITKLRSLGYLN